MPKRAFMSYSWDNAQHKKWVRELSKRLRSDGVEIILDQWELVLGDQIPQFMEKAVRESDYVLIICTRKYKLKSDNREGGVGYEGDIMTAEVLNKRNNRKFIPVLREPPAEASVPSGLFGKYRADLSGNPYSEQEYKDLLLTITGTRSLAPPVGMPTERQAILDRKPIGSTQETRSVEFEPIKIIGVIIDEVGYPINDGTRGCALYKVPFQLSKTPPSKWSLLFLDFWDSPSKWTSMHRPGIARVIGDKVILDGTTIDEVKNYHRETLLLTVGEANRRYKEGLDQEKARKEHDAASADKHKRKVEDVVKQITFDDD